MDHNEALEAITTKLMAMTREPKQLERVALATDVLDLLHRFAISLLYPKAKSDAGD